MSFSSETKAELCDSRIEKRSLALAECYGVLLYCNTFRTSEIRIITASASFSERLPRLFKKAFSFGFDQLPPENAVGKRSFCIQDPEKITRILESFGGDAGGPISHQGPSPTTSTSGSWKTQAAVRPLSRALSWPVEA